MMFLSSSSTDVSPRGYSSYHSVEIIQYTHTVRYNIHTRNMHNVHEYFAAKIIAASHHMQDRLTQASNANYILYIFKC